MSRNLDMTALRSFVTVADLGGVTRASGALNLTQSAVSMQLKRLEEALGLELLDRSNRRVSLTAAGEQLLGYARKMLSLNDEALARMMDDAYEGEVVLGVPHDIVYPQIPLILRNFSAAFPRMRVNLISSFTSELQAQFLNGACDVILTTENALASGGRTLNEVPLVWVGAPGGSIWCQRPLRLAFEDKCSFRSMAQKSLDRAQIPWEMAVESRWSRTIEASVSADLAVHAMLSSNVPDHFEIIDHKDELPQIETQKINLYVRENHGSEPISFLAQSVVAAYQGA